MASPLLLNPGTARMGNKAFVRGAHVQASLSAGNWGARRHECARCHHPPPPPPLLEKKKKTCSPYFPFSLPGRPAPSRLAAAPDAPSPRPCLHVPPARPAPHTSVWTAATFTMAARALLRSCQTATDAREWGALPAGLQRALGLHVYIYSAASCLSLPFALAPGSSPCHPIRLEQRVLRAQASLQAL